MKAPTEFEWDDVKAASNLEKHGLSFSLAASIFLDPDLLVESSFREQDGEERQKAIGMIGDKRFIVVFVMLEATCRLISARRTNPKEDRIYGDR